MINVLPNQQRKIIKRLRALRLASATLWAALCLAIAAAFLMLPLMVTVASRHELVEGQVAALEQDATVASPVDAAALQARTRALAERLAAQTAVAPIERIAALQALAPASVTLAGFSLVEGKSEPMVAVTGIARTREALRGFVSALEADERIAAVDSPVSNYVESSNSQFSLTVTFK